MTFLETPFWDVFFMSLHSWSMEVRKLKPVFVWTITVGIVLRALEL